MAPVRDVRSELTHETVHGRPRLDPRLVSRSAMPAGGRVAQGGL